VTPLIDVVYRGPFQGRRIRFLLDALDGLGATQRLFWLNPEPASRGSSGRSLDHFVADRPGVVSALEVDGRARSLPSAIARLHRSARPTASMALAIGFTSLTGARAVRARRLVWAIQGIPEERLLYHDDLRHRLAVRGLWRTARLGRRPDAAITVSRPMAALVQQRMGGIGTFVVPTVVDRSVFRLRPAGPGRLTYIGSGAPWQDLPLLAQIWGALHDLDPQLRFRVVSRDERAGVLSRALPDDVVEHVEAHGPAAVAAELAGSRLGFIVRRPHLVNEVSYPTKFGEYVASGVGVVTTAIGWDIADVVRSTGCGVVLDVNDPPERMAEQIATYLATLSESSETLSRACDRAAAVLDRDVQVKQLADFLAGLV
jgi:glycosyltransferase involved in cell wall biosynthesis